VQSLACVDGSLSDAVGSSGRKTNARRGRLDVVGAAGGEAELDVGAGGLDVGTTVVVGCVGLARGVNACRV